MGNFRTHAAVTCEGLAAFSVLVQTHTYRSVIRSLTREESREEETAYTGSPHLSLESRRQSRKKEDGGRLTRGITGSML